MLESSWLDLRWDLRWTMQFGSFKRFALTLQASWTVTFCLSTPVISAVAPSGNQLNCVEALNKSHNCIRGFSHREILCKTASVLIV